MTFRERCHAVFSYAFIDLTDWAMTTWCQDRLWMLTHPWLPGGTARYKIALTACGHSSRGNFVALRDRTPELWS